MFFIQRMILFLKWKERKDSNEGPMTESDPKNLDPRVRRTRLLLQEALLRLMQKKNFDEISVQDVTEEATLNRGTLYAHYDDKYALLECVTASRFLGLLEERGVSFDGTCGSALRKILLGICDYLAAAMGDPTRQGRPMDPHMESAIIAVVQKMSLDGLKQQEPWHGPVSREMVATIVSWALYGAAKEWVLRTDRRSAEEIVDDVVGLLTPLVHPITPSVSVPVAIS
jgi:AcrR family transcriptional regulator